MKVKVAHIITRLSPGGSTEMLLNVMKHFSNKYEEILIYGRTEKMQLVKISKLLKNSIKKYYIPFLVREISLFNDAIALLFILCILLYERPQIVHTHTSKAGVLGRISGFFAGIKNIFHTPHGHVFYGYGFSESKVQLFILIERLMAKITRKVLVLSEQEKKDYIALKIGIEDKFILIRNGIDIDKFGKATGRRSEFGIGEDVVVIAVIARLEPVKGVIYFIRAMKNIASRFSNIVGLIVGDGTLYNQLLQEVAILGLEGYVKFLGWREDIPEILSITDIVVVPSLMEGFGIVVLEAYASGKPVVATNVGGLHEIVEDGVTGFLVPPEDSVAIADAVCRLIADKDLREGMGRRGKIKAKQFSLENMYKELEGVYEECLLGAKK
jgi:glycosyltransferase involved in cell wall biosynthesis